MNERILAIDASHKTGSIALLSGSDVVAQQTLDPHGQTARALAPAVASLLEAQGWQPNALSVIAVTVGPGSFTGLRVGLVFAKTLAYATGSDLIGVDTLQAIAAGLPSGPGTLRVAIDAQRQQVVAACYSGAPDRGVPAPVELLDDAEWLRQLNSGDTVCGTALGRLRDHVPPHVSVVEPAKWLPSAAVVGQLALARHTAGDRDDPFQLTPRYFRKSYAEEKRDG